MPTMTKQIFVMPMTMGVRDDTRVAENEPDTINISAGCRVGSRVIRKST